MPKKIDVELKARAARLVTDHQCEYSALTAAAAVVAKQLSAPERLFASDACRRLVRHVVTNRPGWIDGSSQMRV